MGWTNITKTISYIYSHINKTTKPSGNSLGYFRSNNINLMGNLKERN